MLARRIIPCLDVHDGRTTRGQQFGRAELGELRDVGDPVELAVRYDAQGADELVFYDITATADGRGAMLDVITRVAERCFMPLTVGGGVRSLDDVRALTLAGADKVSINSGAITDPHLLARAADHFGSQAVVLSLDVKRTPVGGWAVYAAGGRNETGLEMVAWAEQGAALGAGEIVLNSIDADGMTTGYDIDAIRLVARAVDVADASRRRRAPRYGRFAVVGFLLGAVIAAVLTQFPQGDTPLAQYDPRDVFLILLLGLGTVGVLAGLTWALISDRRSLRRRR